MPKISVVIPSYNRADFIPATLDSVLAQDYKDFEIVFVDDGSTDSTRAIVESYSLRDSRVKYFWQANSERAVARSHGIRNSSGKYVCLVDSDDIWYPSKLQTQLDIMESNPGLVLTYASVNRIDLQGRRVKAASRQHDGKSGFIFYDLLMRNFIPSVTPMIRATVFDGLGDQVTDLIPYEDWDFWLRISRLGEFYHIRNPLGDYRLHPGQSVQNVKPHKIEEVTLKVLDRNTSLEREVLIDYAKLAGFDFDPVDFAKTVRQAYSLAYLRFAYWYLLAGNLQDAKLKLSQSLESASEDRLKDYRYWGLRLIVSLGKPGLDLSREFLGAMH